MCRAAHADACHWTFMSSCPVEYMCAFVGVLLLCMVTQVQGWGSVQACPWLSPFITSRSVTQLSRGQCLSSEEIEELTVMSDRLITHQL